MARYYSLRNLIQLSEDKLFSSREVFCFLFKLRSRFGAINQDKVKALCDEYLIIKYFFYQC